jgi:hypothetical protein
VFLTNAPVDKPLPTFEDDERRLFETYSIKASPQSWSVPHPLQIPPRGLSVHVLCILRLFALKPPSRVHVSKRPQGGSRGKG